MVGTNSLEQQLAGVDGGGLCVGDVETDGCPQLWFGCRDPVVDTE